MAINDWKQANSDYAVVQAGSHGKPRAAIVIGARSGIPTLHEASSGLRWAFMANNPEYHTWFDPFVGDTVNATYQPTLSTGATIATNSQPGGVIRFTTDTDDDDAATLALGLHWTVSSGFTFFTARVKNVTAGTLRAVEIGLSDALSEANGLAFSNHTTSGVTAVATNAVVFGYDTDNSMTSWAALNSNADTEAGVDTGVAVDAAWHKFDIIVTDDGDAHFYIDNTLVASKLLAIATTAVLTPWITLKSLSGATKSIDVDYLGVAGKVV